MENIYSFSFCISSSFKAKKGYTLLKITNIYLHLYPEADSFTVVWFPAATATAAVEEDEVCMKAISSIFVPPLQPTKKVI